MQTLLTALTGYETETAQLRLAVMMAHEQAIAAVSRLDQAVSGHPYAPLWRAYSEVQALADLGQQVDEPSDAKRIFSAMIGAENSILEPAIGRLTLAARNRWRAMEWRKGHDALKETVEAVCTGNPHKGPALLLLIARLHQMERQRQDRCDLIMAVPYALRRQKLTQTVLPGLVGSVRALASREYSSAAMIERFCQRLAGQAEQGLRLLEEISRAVAESQRKVEGAKTQRKDALRRLAWEALWPRPLSPAGLAKRWKQQVSTTSRLLKAGEEIGIVQPIVDRSAMKRPIYQRYAGSLLVQMAGLESTPRGRPVLAPHPATLDALFDEDAFSDALAAVDRMLERFGTPVMDEDA
ncbi:MAG TPA: hypothetical protein VIG90_14590 [Pedomonas sp.]|uniref:hypothetical protein n=1 Tax=Pedomonas sp. TaxID=2976421 RepID=UPI002F3F7BBD